MIKTLYGRGYRFMAEVAEHALPAQDQHPSAPAPESICPHPYRLDEARKHVTVLACGLTVAAAMGEWLQAEILYCLMQEFFELAWHQVHQFEGLMHHVTDDGFVALFGVPQSHEDHSCQPVSAHRQGTR